LIITKRVRLNGRAWKKVSDFVKMDSSISEITGNKVVVIMADALPSPKLIHGHPFKQNQYLMAGALLDKLYIRSVRSRAVLIVTPGLDLGY